MNEERWSQIEEIVHLTLAHASSERNAFLAAACADDAPLRAEVESLLKHEVAAASFIEMPAYANHRAAAWLAAAGDDDEAPGAAVSGQHIGPYKILRELGRGGMGAVYLAERDDDAYRKQVAIKLVKRGFDSADTYRRFRDERQILAQLDHPNIARLFDGGTTPEGAPYFVMEYVEGLTITAYCDHHRLPTNRRLELFRTVCAAVQHAHQNLIVHRDIKPSNILITNDGTPKLLDFGIAKVLTTETPAAATIHEHTRTEMRLLTPDYASPEQVRGEKLTTASDTYSLGVVLYELLTGQRPYRVANSQPYELARMICEQEPTKPSTAVAQSTTDGDDKCSTSTPSDTSAVSISYARDTQPEKLRRRLAGDLDNIVLMAMRKEAARRYASVEQFSEDIRRHLTGLPVKARKDTFGYRSAKFIKRHTAGVAAAALVLPTLIGGIGAVAWQAKIAREQRDGARMAQAKAERINSFLQSILGAADPDGRSRDIKVVEVLNNASAQLETQLADQPELLAQAHLTIGKAYGQLRIIEAAEPHLRAALEINRRLFGDDHPATAEAMLFMGAYYEGTGNYPQAETFLRKSLDTQRRKPTGGKRDLIDTLGYLGDNLLIQHRAAEAEPLLREGFELVRKTYGETSVEYADALGEIGRQYSFVGEPAEAKKYYREAIALYRTFPRGKYVSLVYPLLNYGELLLKEENPDEAEPLLQEAIGLCRERLGESALTCGYILGEMGYAHYLKKDYTRAEDELQRSFANVSQVYAADDVNLVFLEMYLGLTLTRIGKPAQGEPFLRRALEMRQKKLPADDWRIASAESALGDCLTMQKRYAEAELLLVKSYTTLQAAPKASDSARLESQERLVRFYEARGQRLEAARYRNHAP